jgi:hypothetical protein
MASGTELSAQDVANRLWGQEPRLPTCFFWPSGNELMGKSQFLMGKSQFLMGKSTISMV